MYDKIPAPYVVYLYGHIFVPESRLGHKHLVSGKRLNPTELRKTIKLALLVDLYFSNAIDFEIVEVGKLMKRKEVIVKIVKDVEESDFFIEKELISILKSVGKIPLRFNISKTVGLEEKIWMDNFAERINVELTKKGYFTKIDNQLRLVGNKIMSLRKEAEGIKQKIEEFKAKNPELAKLIHEAL
ncbi:MAG: hypothetical protein RMJ15_10930 [Nitrososphaerota archaeon]|nr:hypothetical protein [Candidatus Bathyarchaeota archaeon]MDW8024221.1 hypothetical protein [Nitrososphaerota archaeon]